ncbi:Uma2 family endonuclease [Scytonema sp. UIC 10036]|uniref:Uma2 family endonuclease n=1 Tax=Scytonema sp. UIC 10036 TaxID=2304196 RepID=UPI0012DA9982|nr:Uma2 family endonuclease [Scytonema sp. UIC 10036]MUG97468.1 Uma2 family endonuclease [Scytonema sp. UIC 10036]
MLQPLPNRISFQEFIEWKPEGKRYELHDGIIIEMAQPLGEHEEVTGFLTKKLGTELDRLSLRYLIPKTALVKPLENESAYSPDILIVNKDNLQFEPYWKKESTVTQAASIPLVVEVVSTNWRDDYYIKYAIYEQIGIPEYWIVDYLALGGRSFLGNPKIPTIFICSLIEGEYQMTKFRNNDCIHSPTFPELNLTVQQIFNAD